MILISAFNLYKGGSKRLYEEIVEWHDPEFKVIGYRNNYKKTKDTSYCVYYPYARLNTLYRFMIEQIYVLVLAMCTKPKKVVMMGNFPCLLWFGLQDVYFHNLDYLTQRKRNMKEHVERKMFFAFIKLKQPRLICQTSHSKNECERIFGRLKLKIHVLPIPADNLVRECKVAKKNKLCSSDYYIYPTNDYPYKNISMLYDLKNLNDVPETKLTIKNHEYGKSDFVSQIGTLSYEKLLLRLANSKAMVFLSEYESLGYPLIEAALLQVPIIAIDREYVHACVSTPYVINDAEQLEKIMKVRTLSDKPELKVELSTKFFFEGLKE